jgi:hypothetical protein
MSIEITLFQRKGKFCGCIGEDVNQHSARHLYDWLILRCLVNENKFRREIQKRQKISNKRSAKNGIMQSSLEQRQNDRE